MTTHISLDLETWGKRPGCDIRSIGAVVFDPVAGTVSDDTFYIATDNPIMYESRYNRENHIYKYPLHRDPETVKWWDDQSPEAQAAFADLHDLKLGLAKFSDWFEDVTAFRTLTCRSLPKRIMRLDSPFRGTTALPVR